MKLILFNLLNKFFIQNMFQNLKKKAGDRHVRFIHE